MPKPDIAVVLESMGKKKPMLDDDEEEVDIDTDDSTESAASAFMKAMKMGDASQVAKTLKGFIKLCGDY